MKLKGNALATATKKALEAKRLEDLQRAEQEVAGKVRGLLSRIANHEKNAKSYRELAAAQEEQAGELQKRLDRLKAGDATAMEDPKEEPKLMFPRWADVVDYDRFMVRNLNRKL